MKSRLIEFDNLKNTRDLGGLVAKDGRTIRSGRLIRSGQLVGLSERDREKLSSLVGTVIDMRTEGERQTNPDVVLEGVEYLHIPVVGVLTPGVTREVKSVEELVQVLLFKPEQSLEYMCNLYRQFIRSDFSISAYASFIRTLLEDQEKAVLWHCTAGKDRAGTSAVILEMLLGVPDADVLEDYLFTNANLKDEMDAVIAYAKRKVGSDSPLIDQSLKYLYGADEAYLQAFFDEMESRFGSFQAFVHEALHLKDEDIMRLGNLYLS